MARESLLSNPSTAAERQRLLEQIKKLDEKDDQALREREALIGKTVVAALKEDRLSQEDFSGFITPLITRRAEAKKLGLNSRSKATSPSDDLALADAQDEAEVELEDEPDFVPGTNGYAQVSEENEFA